MSFTQVATYLEIATPSTPGTGKQKIYPKADGLWYTIDDAGIETALSASSGGPAPANATYITQTANAGLSAEQALSALATGLVIVTTATGALTSVAAPAGAVVGTTDTQTLSGKSIVATQLTGDIAVARIAVALTTPGAIGGVTPAALTATAIIGTTLAVASDTDASTILGRARIDSRTTDTVNISHFDQSGTTAYALQQSAVGTTRLNGASGTNLTLGIAGASAISISAALVTAALPATVAFSDAATTTIVPLLTLDKGSTGTPAAGFGGSIPMNLESSTTAAQNAALIEWLWQTATHASRAGDLVLSAYNVASKREGLRIRGGAAGPEVGMFAVTPVTQSAGWAVTNPATRKTFDTTTVTLPQLAEAVGTIIAALIALGPLAA